MRSALLALAPLFACASSTPPCDPLTRAGDVRCGLAAWPERGAVLHLPPTFDAATAFPVVLALHGAAGDAEKLRRLSCGPAGIGCLDAIADREGFVVAYAEGTPTAGLETVRAWNAGGGERGFRCVSGAACREGVDDVGFARALIDELDRLMNVDRSRVYVVGFSNGAAMAHRLACEVSDRVAGIVAVGGANQVAEVQGCEPALPVGVLQIHGSEDPCWPFDGGVGACLEEDGEAYVGATRSTDGWVARNACPPGPPTVEMLDDRDPSDQTRASRMVWQRCAAPVVMVRVDGGGHTWPGGAQYLDVGAIGRVSADLSASELAWAFLAPLRGR